ncbi:head maturation protease, ClpP-related [Pseudochelatococcus sp. G4_1912]|uniref:head maturation protease, ClpP-related n=1 Tax=Pseudochelatococcus sp. G4_1912 TaxID=3114288 RepID=UPI0039C6F81C
MPIYQDGALHLYGVVGENYWGEGFTALQVVEALAGHGRDNDITVRVNSGGGIASEGIAIFNALTAHKGRVRIEVDAIAASAASIIAMAGDDIVMRSGALMMIHDPASFSVGTADDHEKQRDLLDKIGTQMAAIYADRSGQQASDVRAAMKQELWLTPSEAVELGYATDAEEERALAWAAFDYRIYAQAPAPLTALAKSRRWTLPKNNAPPAAKATAKTATRQQEKAMSGITPAASETVDIDTIRMQAASDAVRAYRDRRTAVLALDEAKGREKLAEALLDTELPVEQIKAALGAAPVASDATAPDANAYEAARAVGAGLSSQPPVARGDHGWSKVISRINGR